MLFNLRNLFFPSYKQLDSQDCAAVCIKIIAEHYGKIIEVNTIRTKLYSSIEGSSLADISTYLEEIGFDYTVTKINFKKLNIINNFPVIIHWKQNHFVVVYKINKKIYVVDPAIGKIKYEIKEFINGWYNVGELKGICVFLSPNNKFRKSLNNNNDKIKFKQILSFAFNYKFLFYQLILSLFIVSGIQLLFPLLTQYVVDYGIKYKSLKIIYVILFGQIILISSRTISEFLRGWVILHISTRFNLAFISQFLNKLMNLPLKFFEERSIGDILQRIVDHKRVDTFLTSTFLNMLHSIINLVVYSVILLYYKKAIFLIFFLSSLVYILWITLFLRKRKTIDYQKFNKFSDNQNVLLQIVKGIQEIKLTSIQKIKRWEWEDVNSELFDINISSLKLEQAQQLGAIFVNELKNVIIIFIAAEAVINSEMSLGVMVSILFILGYLNKPLENILQFLKLYQDASLSLIRINEIHAHDEEHLNRNKEISFRDETKGHINLNNLYFAYSGNSSFVLSNINLQIEKGKTTAIVGSSGCGKTTLLKLLLGFYKPSRGNIYINGIDLNEININSWRTHIGVVMQDGYIFSDTIENNILMYDNYRDESKLNNALILANLLSWVVSLPNGLNTKIGVDGQQLSQGQKQRILLARIFYKNPRYIFMDEATNALDTENEKIIVQNLETCFSQKTQIIIAHRLSTIKRANNIIVLDKGRVVEQGNHTNLVLKKERYYELVRNQLELE